MNDRVDPRRFRPWLLLAACLAAALGASLLPSVSWREYARYVVSRLGWELAAALLTASLAVIGALFFARRRHVSAIVAASLFASVVIHMLLVSFLGVVTLKHTTVVVGHEKMREIAFGLPSLSESLAGQELRAMFREKSSSDTRSFPDGKKAAIDLLKAEPAAVSPKPGQNDVVDRAPAKMEFGDTFAAKEKQDVKDLLAEVPAATPETARPQIAMLREIETGDEALRKVKPLARELKVQPVAEARPDLAADAQPATGGAKLQETRRELAKEKIEVAASSQAARNVLEEMRGTEIRDKTDRLIMKAATEQVARGAADQASRPGARAEFDVSHKAAVAPEAPAPKMLKREVAAARRVGAPDSLADSSGARSERQVTVDAAAIAGAVRPAGRPDAPVRIQNTMAAVERAGPAAQQGERTLSARGNLRSVRAGGNVAGTEVATVVPRAQVVLQVGQAAPEKSFAAGRFGEAAVARGGKPGIQENLSAEAGRGTAVQPIMAVGGAAEPAKGWSAESAPSATGGLSGERGGAMASSRAETGIANATDGPVTRSSRPAGVDLSRRGSYAVGTGVQDAPDVVPVSRPQAGSPAAGGELAGSGGSRLVSERAYKVNLGAAALPAAGGAAAGLGASGTTGGSSDGRQDLSAGRRKTGLSGIEAAPVQRLAVGDTLGSGSGAGPGKLGDAASPALSGIAGGAGPRTAVSVQEMAGAGNGAGVGRADRSAVRMIPGAAQVVQSVGELSVTGSSGLGGGGTGGSGPGSGGAEISVGKATGLAGELSVPGRWTGRAPVLTAGRMVGQSGSLVGNSEIAAGGLAAGTTLSGIGSGVSLSSAPAASGIAKSDRVALGIAAREAAGSGSPAGGGGGGQATASGASTGRSEVRVAKAGGQLAADSGPGASGRGSAGLESIGISSSLSRAPARLDVDVGGKGAGTAGFGIPAGIRGEGVGTEAPRTVISSEIASVPASVPEKALYKLRDPEKRKEFIAELGGSEKTEQGVERALAWLAATQSDDGRWDIDGFKTISKCGGPGDQVNEDTALTGLCLLSYLGAGYTHVKGDHKETVRRAVNWLVVGQKEDGNLQREGQMYGQAIGTAALCECYSMTGDKRLVEPIQKAIDFILRAQNPGAGWRYQPRTDNDTSVTGWQVLALKSAMIAGIKFPPEHFDWVEKWLDCVRRGEGGGLYTYMPGHGATPTMTAEGWFCQLLMKEQTRTRGQAETIPYLMEHLPAWTPKDGGINLYFWYYATLALHMSGAPEFQTWNKALTKALLAGQVRSGPAAGSWDPVDILGERGGRIYSTAASALCLEVYYRYLPFYKQR